MEFHPNTRLLLVGDSFARRNENIIRTRYPAVALKVIALGEKTTAITTKYNAELQDALVFNPTHIIQHEGHNDLAFHPSKNPLPDISRDVAASSIALALHMHLNHPQARIYISATLPRSLKRYSVLNLEQVLAFNTRAKRHGQRIRTLATRNNIGHILNNFIWASISQAKEDSSVYEEDGIHLTSRGMHAQAREWLGAIAIPN